MGIIKRESKIYIYRLYCDDCGTEMENCNVVIKNGIPQFNYVCPNCKKGMVLNEQYPKREIKEIKEINNCTLDEDCVEGIIE